MHFFFRRIKLSVTIQTISFTNCCVTILKYLLIILKLSTYLYLILKLRQLFWWPTMLFSSIYFYLILQESYNRTKRVLIKNKEKVTKLAEGLMKYETLDMEEIKQIVEGKEVVRTWPMQSGIGLERHFNTWWWLPLTGRNVREKFYINGCCCYLQRHWWGLGDSPHADQLAKFHIYIDNGICKQKVVWFFFKLKKIKFIISNMFHLVWKFFWGFENLKKKKALIEI